MKKQRSALTKIIVSFILVVVALYVRQALMTNFLFGSLTRQEGNYTGYINFGGLSRSYVVHEPLNYDKNQPMPLVLILHGAGGNAEMMMKMTGLDVLSDQKGFLAVYPNGTGLFSKYVLSWNAGSCCNYVEPLGVDDVGFLRLVIEQVQKEYNLDKNRIYVAGISNGGMMAYRLACEMPDIIAGIASVSSTMSLAVCAPQDFVSIISFHGTADSLIPLYGGEGGNVINKIFGLNHRPEPEVISFWAKHNLCSSVPTSITENGATGVLYSNCQKNTEILFFTIEQGEHAWPGGEKNWFWGNKPSEEIPASAMIWDFFEKHYKI